MNSLRIILLALSLPTVCLTLAACDRYMAERYLVRHDAVTSSAGDAVASNSAVQIPDPWPRGSNNPNIAFDGAKIAGAVNAYRTDTEFLRDGEKNQDKDKANIGRAPGGGGGGGGFGGIGGGGGGPPPG
ncbi:MAG: hypothetical protein ACREDJ_10715, partial [Methylocella sp.]